jgi:hypothetical protein
MVKMPGRECEWQPGEMYALVALYGSARRYFWVVMFVASTYQ